MVRRGRTIEIDTLEQFDALLAPGGVRMSGWRLQDLDLRDRSSTLHRAKPAGALFLGCTIADDDLGWLTHEGALVFPDPPELPFDAYRSRVYSPAELYAGLDGAHYARTPDAAIYAWSRKSRQTRDETMSRALHDSAIDEALSGVLKGRRAVGVMGGHAVARDSASYREAALLGRSLARAGSLVVTGGGPGAMEAANLGAYLSDESDGALDEALTLLAETPSFRPSIGQWARAAFDVLHRWPDGVASVGIPTWFYGHEPPNPFATAIAKYFQNALREDSLLRRCDGGIVFLPGAAGTVQEIYQDACENYYAGESTVAPMVLVGRAYWTETVPAWPLLQKLAADRAMAGHIHLVADAVDVVSALS